MDNAAFVRCFESGGNLSGEGDRSRVELTAPCAGGRAHLAVELTAATGRATTTRWSLDWTRRARTRGG